MNRVAFVVQLVRIRARSLALSLVFALITAWLLHVPFVVAALTAGLIMLIALHGRPRWERLVLWLAGCRPLTHLERERLRHPAVSSESASAAVVVCAHGDPWLLHCARRLVVSAGLLDLLEDRALTAYIAQAQQPVYLAAHVAETIVWSLAWPALTGWALVRLCSAVGRLLAIVVGCALLLPMIFWPDGFVRHAGVALGGVTLCCVLLMLAAGGQGHLVVLVIVSLIAWRLLGITQRAEGCGVEDAADRATIEAGLGVALSEALDTLVWVEPIARPRGVLGLLFREGETLSTRAERLWRILHHT